MTLYPRAKTALPDACHSQPGAKKNAAGLGQMGLLEPVWPVLLGVVVTQYLDGVADRNLPPKPHFPCPPPIVILGLIVDFGKFPCTWLESRIYVKLKSVSTIHLTHFLTLFSAHNEIKLMCVLGKSSWVGGLLFFPKISNPQSIFVDDRQTKLTNGQKLL